LILNARTASYCIFSGRVILLPDHAARRQSIPVLMETGGTSAHHPIRSILLGTCSMLSFGAQGLPLCLQTIKSFLVEAGAIAALVAASEVLPWDGTANDAHSAVALCLWGLMIGHKPNKIKVNCRTRSSHTSPHFSLASHTSPHFSLAAQLLAWKYIASFMQPAHS
jgi:hypothetical protein